MKLDDWTDEEYEQCWYCDWCSRPVKDSDEGFSDSTNTQHCSQECADESDFSKL